MKERCTKPDDYILRKQGKSLVAKKADSLGFNIV
jgi:hypothetical protein